MKVENGASRNSSSHTSQPLPLHRSRECPLRTRVAIKRLITADPHPVHWQDNLLYKQLRAPILADRALLRGA